MSPKETHSANRDEALLFSVTDSPWRRLDDPGLIAGVDVRIASRDSVTGGATFMARLPAGWRRREQASEATLELFVLEGALEVEGREARVGGFVSLPRGRGGAELASPAGALVYLFWSPSLALGGEPFSVLDTMQEPWLSRASDDRPAGYLYKSLRRPDHPRGAAEHGFLRLVMLLPGWISPRREVHHGCWEENLMLRGDLLMPGRGVMRPGTNLANPPGLWHGPMISKGGALMLINCATAMDVEYGEVANADELDAYLQTAPWE